MDIIITCDIGTTACKCTAFKSDGSKISDVRMEYPTEYPRPGWAQQSADMLCDAALRGLRTIAGGIDPHQVRAIGLSGQMNALIPVDEGGHALYPNIIHSDSRSAPQIDEIAAHISPGDFYALTGNRLDCHYTLTKLLWLKRHEPDIYAHMRWAMQSKDYVRTRLTGVCGITDFSDAGLTIAQDITTGDWARDMLCDLGIDPSIMPRILPAHDVSGRLCADAARYTGLIEGTPVAVGGGDGACTARGAGLDSLGAAYCYIGSSAWVAQLTASPVLDKDARVFNYRDLDGVHNYTCGTLQCGAAAYDWARGMMGLDGTGGIAAMESMASEIGPGADGVIFFPELMGSRTPYWDPLNRGCLCGLSLYHDRRHVARAVYEGVAQGLYSCGLAMAENGLPVKSLMLTGGGAQSKLWPKMLAALYRCPVDVHAVPGEATSLGAAIAAGVGVGLYSGYDEGAKLIHASETYECDPLWAEAYARIYDVFKRVYYQVSPIHKALREK